MKKLIFVFISVSILAVATAAFAESYGFESGLDGLKTVTNSLEAGGEAAYGEGFKGQGLALDGRSGLSLGAVGESFTASAMVKVTSGGDNRTLFFKNMGSFENENWTGVIFNGGVPTFWVREGWSKRPTTAKNVMNQWVYVVYTEDKGIGRLYVDGEAVSEGTVVSDPGELYLGVTYWSADALSGGVDEVEVLDRALTAEEIMANFMEKVVPVRFEAYSFPSALLVSDLDLSAVPGGADVEWTSNNEKALSSGGVLTRPAEDTKITLTGRYRGLVRSFEFTALGRGNGGGGDVILSYLPKEANTGVITDQSGSGNHGVIHGDLTDGNFDGGDYIDLPKGLFAGLDQFTLALRLTPWTNTAEQSVFCFGNSAEEYFSLNTSTPGTNLLRAAVTKSGASGEKDLVTAPGIKSMRFASIVITAEGHRYKMYVDGLLVAEDDLGVEVSDLGNAVKSYIGKSLWDGPNFRGTIDEFTLYSHAMDAEEVYDRFRQNENTAALEGAAFNDGYINDCVLSDGSLCVYLNRDCMVAVTSYSQSGEPLYSAVRKVSMDNLKAEFVVPSDSVEVMAFDPATGALKDRRFDAFVGNGPQVSLDGGGCIKLQLLNNTEAYRTVVIEISSYDGTQLSGLDYCTVGIDPDSSARLTLNSRDGQKLDIWEKGVSLTRRR